MALQRVKRLQYCVKWQSISARSGPQKGNTLPVVWIFCNVFSRKCTERGFRWYGRQGAILWGPERVTEPDLCLSIHAPKMQCRGSLLWVWFHVLSGVFLILRYNFLILFNTKPKRPVLVIICPPCSRCYLSYSTKGCLCSGPQALQEPASWQHRQRSPFAASGAPARRPA